MKRENKEPGYSVTKRDHWEKDLAPTKCADMRYASQFGAAEELKESVDKLAEYTRKNRMKY